MDVNWETAMLAYGDFVLDPRKTDPSTNGYCT
jgi:3-hydroxy-9,10-secoandrosta-1,3,5(10)-triene-9,17-dione monooxygenase